MNAKLKQGIAVATGLVVIFIFFMWNGSLPFFSSAERESDGVVAGESTGVEQPLPNTAGVTDLQIQEIQVGDGPVAEKGKIVTVHYAGLLQDGTVFDNSVERGEPITFQLGAGDVIPGWEKGIEGMRVGGRRILVIPPSLGYGDEVRGPIPANSTLIFEVVLVDVKDPQ